MGEVVEEGGDVGLVTSVVVDAGGVAKGVEEVRVEFSSGVELVGGKEGEEEHKGLSEDTGMLGLIGGLL